ncbi:heat shock protein HslJ [Dysgonomonas hofstadii]|uniref:Heat shock protein HslJ n=1 Tax=Dysgonomonas hofstadii TaxID=637886 RepID=A0A840CQ07_9BACT|nr:META domain-containing protein [Dysgonomonas hofstadii]MBB4036769.1 heat shock protein HslJ [Dysgonomonas hofstadii]
MKIIKLLFIAALAIFALQSCNSAKTLTKEQLANKWVLKSINGQDVKEAFPNKIPHITFNLTNGQMNGNGGCNGFGGTFSINKDEFTGSKIVSTMMFCGDQESTLFKLLDGKSKLALNGDELTFSQNGKTTLVFTRAQPLGAADLAGEWKLQSINGKSEAESETKKMPTLEFNFAEKRLAGLAGCNRYNGAFTLENNVLTVTPLATTRMACPNMEMENEFVKTFTGKIDLEKETDNLLVMKKDGRIIIIFEKQ